MILAVVVSGCTSGSPWLGYYPKVEGPTGPQYWADVRDCQTATLYGTTRARMDACMAQRGYRLAP